jgi:hypothetical protein
MLGEDEFIFPVPCHAKQNPRLRKSFRHQRPSCAC